jgi:hypothetical protein
VTGIQFGNLVAAVTSHAQTLGVFDTVNGAEPKTAPGNGVTAAVWADRGAGVQSSGLASTSALVVMNVRLYADMLSDPPDAIDPQMIAALDALITAYSGDFELDAAPNVRCVDLLGISGTSLSWQAGYISQDGKMFRAVTITLPLLINDAWEQVP